MNENGSYQTTSINRFLPLPAKLQVQVKARTKALCTEAVCVEEEGQCIF